MLAGCLRRGSVLPKTAPLLHTTVPVVQRGWRQGGARPLPCPHLAFKTSTQPGQVTSPPALSDSAPEQAQNVRDGRLPDGNGTTAKEQQVKSHTAPAQQIELTAADGRSERGNARQQSEEGAGQPRLTKDGKVDRRCFPRSQEVKDKISKRNKGSKRSLEVRQKMSESMKNKSLETRVKMSKAKLGVAHSLEVRAKIAATLKATKAKKKAAKLAAQRSAPGQPGAAARTPLPGRLIGSGARRLGESDLSELAREKAVVEMTALRRELNAWMQTFEKVYGYQPIMNDTAKTHPEVYKRFVRYVALRELVRQGQ